MDKGEYEDVLEELLEDEEGVVSLDACDLCGDTFAQGRFTCGLCEREVCRQCLAQPATQEWAVCRVCGGRIPSPTRGRSGSLMSAMPSVRDRDPVVSSLIASIGYDEDARILCVEFHNGSVYEYFDVPKEEYGAFMLAESKGRHFNLHVRGHYEYGQVE